MRNLLLTLVPTVALMAAPAFAQSSVSTSETTTSTATAPVPAPETTSKEVYKSESTPGGDSQVQAKTQQTVNPDGTSEATSEQHAQVNNADGSHAESSSTTTKTGPN